MEEAIKELTKTIRILIEIISKNQNSFDWNSIISSICSVLSLIAIVVLLIERYEKKRPYLQVSFELIRSNLVCLVIRNVGETPAKLKSIEFNDDFTIQLPNESKKTVKNRDDLNITIFPQQKWIISLNVITSKIMDYENKELIIKMSYICSKKTIYQKKYIESEIINFDDYASFLVYISEVDELKNEIKNLTKSINAVSEKYSNKI